MASPLDSLRFAFRSLGFVGVTFGMYGLLEVDTLWSGDAKRDLTLSEWVGRYGDALCKLWGLDLRVEGTPPGQPPPRLPGQDSQKKGRLFIMNHRSSVDILVSLRLCDCTIVSRADLARWPVIGMAARRVGTLFVDRASRRSGAQVMHRMADALKAGKGVMVFPEGTTYEGDEVRNFQQGGFWAAVEAQAEVVPIGVAYAGNLAFGDESFGEHMRKVSDMRQVATSIVVGEPIPAGSSVDALRDLAHSQVQALVHRARANLGT